MNSRKKIISLLMVLVLTFAFSVNVFASENDIPAPPENVEKHTIELTVDPAENVGIQPYIWGQQNYPVSGLTYTEQFVIPDRYFAYEMIATGSNASYSVSLMYGSIGLTCEKSGIANGSNYKADWINVYAGNSYNFRIQNNSNIGINVTITYYSWK